MSALNQSGWKPTSPTAEASDGATVTGNRALMLEEPLLFEIGRRDLRVESSINADVGLRLNTSRVQGEWNVYHNRIADYIYLAPIGQPGRALDSLEVRQGNAQDHPPGIRAQRQRLDHLLAGQGGDMSGDIADHERRDPDHDQRHLGRLAQSKDDKQDGKESDGRDHGYRGHERAERGSDRRQGAQNKANQQRRYCCDPQTQSQPPKTGEGVGPEQILARQRIGFEQQSRHRRGHCAGKREDLVRRIVRMARRGGDDVADRQHRQWQRTQ